MFRHLTILLVFLSTFSQALKNPINKDLLELYISAIQGYNQRLFTEVLDDNFGIYDKDGGLIAHRERLNSLSRNHYRFKIPIKAYEIYDNVPGVSFKVRVNKNLLIEYKTATKDGIYKITKESWLTSHPEEVGFFPLVDYDKFAKEIARCIIAEYREMLFKTQPLSNILDENYVLISSDRKNRTQFRRELEILEGNIVVRDLDDKLIENAEFLGNQKLEFVWNHTTLFRAKYLDKKQKYVITSERQTHNDYKPYLTALIDEHSTSLMLAQTLAIEFFTAMKNKDKNKFNEMILKTVKSEGCVVKRDSITREEFFKNHRKLVRTIPKVVDTYRVQEDFRDGKISFWVYLDLTGKDTKMVKFDVDLLKKNSRLTLKQCPLDIRVEAKLTKME